MTETKQTADEILPDRQSLAPFVRNRERLLARMPAGSAALVYSGEVRFRNRDVDYPFRVDSDFYYLTGFEEPESTLLLVKTPEGESRSYAFVRPRDPDAEIWTGRRLGVERAPEALGVDEAFEHAQRLEKWPELMKGVRAIWCSFSQANDWWPLLAGALEKMKRHVRDGIEPPVALNDLDTLLHELRLIKQPWEIARLRRAAHATVAGHRAAMEAARHARSERQIAQAVACAFHQAGAQRLAFNTIAAAGANACILHYTENSAPLDPQGLILVDAGAEVDYYAGDVTTTFPASGRFSAEQKALYECVLNAQQAAIAQVRPGLPYDAHHAAAVRVLTEGLVTLGLLKGDVETLIERKAYQRFYMHKTGHWLGLDVHDVGRYRVEGRWRPLAPGMTLTVEPGLYIAPNDETVAPRWRGIGIRIEDDVLVTEDGCETLTRGLPRTVAEIEEAMK